MVVAIFRARVRPEHAAEYFSQAERMAEIARSMRGFLSWKGYTADDGERVSVHEWASSADLAAWRDHPEHVRMRQLGRERYYTQYTLWVCDEPRESRFVREAGTDGSDDGE
jgi:heme-degrading monooxygenase HmoA